MYLKSIEIHGFKSFAKKSFLEFNAPISAIVGPNGSGKSNIAEAFRFVLGEQSIKSLRGKRGEDLIFNGSDEAPRMNRAGVKLVFDNSKRVLDLDFDEVEIERVVHRDSENQYFINKSPVRLKDIHELLSKAHIGSTGHHIISQGEADKILSSSPKERRQAIEDALGLKIYQFKREESQKKLEKTAENIKQVESLRREIAPHLRFLKKQVEKVEKAEELKDELKDLYHVYLSSENSFIKKETEEINTLKNPLIDKKTHLEKRIEEIRNLLLKEDKKDHKSEEVLAIESEFEKIRREKSELTLLLGRLQGELSFLAKRLREDTETKVSSSSALPYVHELEDLLSGLSGISNPDEIAQRIEKIKKTLSDLKNLFHGGEARDDIEIDVRKTEEKIKDIEKNLKEKEERERELLVKMNALKESLTKEKDEDRQKEREVFDRMSELNEIQTELSRIDNREARLLNDVENFKKESYEAGQLIGREAVEFIAEIGELVSREVQEERLKKIERIKIRLEESGVGGDEIVKEFKEVSERDTFLERELTDLSSSLENLKNLIVELEIKLSEEFARGLHNINSEFDKFFGLMFDGGHAALKIVSEKKRKRSQEEDEEKEEEEEETEEGIEIEVSLPRKKVKGLVMLSGGERALTSIALLFAISQVNPPPFIILDETDAALDEANSKKYGDMIENLSNYSQLILITHNRETMSRAGVLYGVTMGGGGVSKLLSIKFEDALAVAK